MSKKTTKHTPAQADAIVKASQVVAQANDKLKIDVSISDSVKAAAKVPKLPGPAPFESELFSNYRLRGLIAHRREFSVVGGYLRSKDRRLPESAIEAIKQVVTDPKVLVLFDVLANGRYATWSQVQAWVKAETRLRVAVAEERVKRKAREARLAEFRRQKSLREQDKAWKLLERTNYPKLVELKARAAAATNTTANA